MTGYILNRLASAVLVVLLVTLISFSVMLLVPGDPAAVVAGATATEEEIQAIRVQLGLHLPFHERLLEWLLGLLQGDLGRSHPAAATGERGGGRAAAGDARAHGLAMVLTAVAGIALGIARGGAAGHAGRPAVMTVALIGVSLPNFWLGGPVRDVLRGAAGLAADRRLRAFARGPAGLAAQR